jgi:hypothetical protein
MRERSGRCKASAAADCSASYILNARFGPRLLLIRHLGKEMCRPFTSLLNLLPVPSDQLAKITHGVRIPFVGKWPKTQLARRQLDNVSLGVREPRVVNDEIASEAANLILGISER